ncbi:MAG: hypothetical protein AB7I27_11505 [Bacteriovoracaceae bacterium]
MGEADSELQTDPLATIFSDIYDTSKQGENKKIKLYARHFKDGIYLNESCTEFTAAPKYATSWQENQAKRSVAATLQYIGLDSSVKAIGAYAKELKLSDEEFEKLSANLVKNYCSKNLSVFSLKQIQKSLSLYFKKPVTIIPSVNSSPFATVALKDLSEKEESRSKEFDFAIKNFRAFCSWGGETQDYRMLPPYLSNRFIMSFVINNMLGVQNHFDESKQTVIKSVNKNTAQVLCTDLICRKTDPITFKNSFPKSIGSTGLDTDLIKLYCHHFRYQDYDAKKTIPEVSEWIKQNELETSILETNYFISMMTGVPDLFFSAIHYQEVPMLVKSSIDERWDIWAQRVLSTFSKDLYYEESLKIKARPRRDNIALRTEGFGLDFFVTLGEMDRVLDETDKLSAVFHLKIPKNYLRHIGQRWKFLVNEIDLEGQKQFKKEMASFIDLQIKDKEILFRQKMWNKDFSRLIAEELLGQTLAYQGPLFDSFKDEVLTVPVKFSYGPFALGYLRYRADVSAGRLKLNL